jgi:hemerythrin-like domain-containing protein
MRITEELRTEHDGMNLALQILDILCNSIISKKTFPKKDVAFLLEYFDIVSNKCHHKKEENVLIPALKNTYLSKNSNYVSTLLLEHQIDGELIYKLDKYASDIVEHDTLSATSLFISHAHEYIDLLDSHMLKENSILFKFADEYCTEQQCNKMLKDFKKIEEDTIGIQKYGFFQTSLTELRDKYLNLA